MLTRPQECLWVYSLCRLCDNHVVGTPMDEACHVGNHGTRGRVAARIDFLSIKYQRVVLPHSSEQSISGAKGRARQSCGCARFRVAELSVQHTCRERRRSFVLGGVLAAQTKRFDVRGLGHRHLLKSRSSRRDTNRLPFRVSVAMLPNWLLLCHGNGDTSSLDPSCVVATCSAEPLREARRRFRSNISFATPYQCR